MSVNLSFSIKNKESYNEFENRVLKRIFGHNSEEYKGPGENSKIRSFLILTLYQISLKQRRYYKWGI
jgi:hypothetical protein